MSRLASILLLRLELGSYRTRGTKATEELNLKWMEEHSELELATETTKWVFSFALVWFVIIDHVFFEHRSMSLTQLPN